VTLRRLVMWRHGETDYNADRRMQGQLDSMLTPLGLAQARRAAPVLAGFAPQLLVTSDLRRASDTAAVLAEHLGLPMATDKRLRETHLGQWQGLTHAEVDARWPGARMIWRTDPEWAPPGGETRVEVAARAGAVVAELDAGTAETAVLCVHGGVIAGLSASLLGLPVRYWPLFLRVGNCRWTVLERPRPARVADAAGGAGGGPGAAGVPVDRMWRLVTYNTGLFE
jgi:broad specificity phosphatase PhoE